MGKWSQQFFERDYLPEVCFIIPGSTKPEIVEQIYSQFDSISFHQHTHFERAIGIKAGIEYVVILQAYGAPTIIDLISILKDGCVKSAFFIGSAFCFLDDLNIGDLMIPNAVQSLDGIITLIEGEKYSYPNDSILHLVKESLVKKDISFTEGKTVSVPCVTAQPKPDLIDNDVIGLEMECASFLYYSEKLNIKSAAILIVSDTKKRKLIDNNGDYRQRIIEVLRCFI